MPDTVDMTAPTRRAPSGLAGAAELDRFAPRIEVVAFCVTSEFAGAFRAAHQDRRMSKAKCGVAMGGAAMAVKRFANVGAPNLVVIETDETDCSRLFAELEPLAEVCDEDTKVIVAGPSNDVTLYRELLRMGVDEYLVTPASPVQIIEAITTIYADPDSSPAARAISFFGVKGGVGSSTLAHNVAWRLAEHARRDTILVDLDIEFGTAALDFNIESRHSVVDALADLDGLDEGKMQRLLVEHSERLKLLSSPSSVQSKIVFDDAAAIGLIENLRYSCDTLVLDLPHSWSEGVRSALRQSDEVVLVATPDLACVRNMKSIYDWVKGQRLPDDSPPRIVMNQLGMAKRPEVRLSDFVEIVGAEIDLTLPYDGAVFGAAMTKGQMLSELSIARKISDQIDAFTVSAFGREGRGGRQGGRARGSIASWLASFAKK